MHHHSQPMNSGRLLTQWLDARCLLVLRTGGAVLRFTWLIGLFVSVPAFAEDLPVVPKPSVVRCLAFSPDSRSLAAAASQNTADGRLKVWDTKSWKLRYSDEEAVGFPQVAFSPDGKVLALSRFAPETKLFDADTGQLVGELKGHTNHARCLCFTSDGKHIITGSYDQTIKIWDAATGKTVVTMEGAGSPVYDIAVSPDGMLLAAAEARGRRVSLWDLKTHKQVHTFTDLGSLVPDVMFSPKGQLLAAASWSGYLHLFDVTSREKWLRLRPGGGVHGAAYSPDQRWLAVVTNGRFVYLFPGSTELDDEAEQKIDGLLARFEDDSYAVREQASKELAEFGMAAERKLSEALTSKSAETRIRVRELRRKLTNAEGAVQLAGHQAALECVTISPDGKMLASGDKRGQIVVWSVGDWKKVASLQIGAEQQER